MWKQRTENKVTGYKNERVINNRYFTELLLRAVSTERDIISITSGSDDGLSNKVIIEDAKCIRYFEYLKGLPERPTIVDDRTYHE